MKLLYLYVKNHACFVDQEFNFDSRWNFHLIQNGEEYFLECEINELFPDNFFSTDKNKGGPISSISAIIGNNGSGKTSIARVLDDLLVNINHMFEHIIIYEIEHPNKQGRKIICQYNLLKKITSEMLLKHYAGNENHLEPCLNNFYMETLKEFIAKPFGSGMKKLEDLPETDRRYRLAYDFFTLNLSNIQAGKTSITQEIFCPLVCESSDIEIKKWSPYNWKDSLQKDFGFVYYSPFYTTEHNFASSAIYDLSTTHCLTTGAGSRCEYYQNSSTKVMILPQKAHKAYEYKWALKFLSALKGKKIPSTYFEINRPFGIIISPETDLLKISLDDLISLRNKYGEDIKKNGTESVKEKSQYLFKLYQEIVAVIIKKRTDDFFINAFICFFASFCRDHLRGAISVSSKKNPTNEFETVQVYLDLLKDIEENMPPYQTPQNMASLYERILVVLEKNDNEAYKLFLLLKELYTDYLSKNFNVKITPEVYCLCFEEKWFNWTLDFIDAYFRSLSITNFLKFEFSPRISSGEMSYISMFARIFEKIQDKSNPFPSEILLFLDEVETTLHPQWQLKLVYLLIKFWEIFSPNHKVHMIFASHSPMLLSDIPLNNVVFLQKQINDNTSKTVTNKILTFGANVFDLYRYSFFLENGTIGLFASQIIENLLHVVNKAAESPFEKEMVNNQNLFNSYAELIGDSNIREYLLKKYAESCCLDKKQKILQYKKIIDSLQGEPSND